MNRRRVVFVIAVAVVAAVGLAAIVRVYQQSRAALVTAAEAELRTTALEAAAEASELFAPATLVIDRIIDARLPELSQVELERILFAIASYPVHSYPQINGIYVGMADGSFLHLTDLVPEQLKASGDVPVGYKGLIRRVLTRHGALARDLWFYQDQATKGWWTATTPPVPQGYDPRERPWFKAAVAANGVTWSKPYRFASTNDLGITLSAPIKDRTGALWGVVGVDFSMNALAALVLDYRIKHVGSSGFLMVGDAEGHVIGHSQMQRANEAMAADPKLSIEDAISIRNVHLSSGDDVAVFDAIAGESGTVRYVTNGDHDVLGVRLPLDEELNLPDYVFVGQSLDAVAGPAIRDLRRNLLVLAAMLAIVTLVAFYAVKLRSEVATRKRAQDALKIAKEVAEDATKAKSSFLAMMSHEIRTPMNGVMSMAEMLDQTDLSDDQRGMSSVIRSSASALLTIINDILDFSKIEAGKLDIESVPFSLIEIVEGVGELTASRAEERGIDLIVDLDPALPDALVGDPARLRQVLLNLMGNAIKFTEVGSVALVVHGRSSGGDVARLRFEVRDSGIGISEEQRQKLFQPFVQADTSTSRKYGGTGLGLSICHRLCVMMGGSIGVDSQPGEGSTFWFELPFGISDPQPAIPAIAIADGRVAALGFDGAERDALARLFAAAGIRDITWAGLDHADIDAVEGRIIVLRAHVGTADASAFARRAGRREKVILAAPRGLASTLALAADDGVFATITLPIRRGRLWHAIAAALGRAELKSRQAVETSDTIGWVPPDIGTARANNALVLVAEDNATNQVVIRRLLSQRGYAIDLAENGAIALDRYRDGGHGLLLTDFHMPEMDGFQLTAAIREIEAGTGAHLPIVALTADALPGTEKLCIDAGMDGYLTKPIDSRALTAALERFLPHAAALRSRAVAAAAPSSGPAEPEINPDILDLGRIRETFGAINDDAVAFLRSFVDDVPRMIEAIKTGLDAQNRDEARHAAHALKGAARSSGANRLGQLAADIQDRLDDNDLQTPEFLYEALLPTHEELRDAFAQLRAHALEKR